MSWVADEIYTSMTTLLNQVLLCGSDCRCCTLGERAVQGEKVGCARNGGDDIIFRSI